MGDGIQRRFALIINGDTEVRHLRNVDRAVAALRAEGRYEISVASTQTPAQGVEHYLPANAENLQQLIQGIHSDDDDLIVVYVTGHGGPGDHQEGCVSLSSGCYSYQDLSERLDNLSYGRRVVVTDTCFSGGNVPLFANPRSTVVTQGSAGELVGCQSFAPYFWSRTAPDSNRDGVRTIRERFNHALQRGRTNTEAQFYEPSEEVGLSGHVASRGRFQTRVVHVSNPRGLQAQLRQLRPGEFALVDFAAPWCRPCRMYRPTFDGFARNWHGRFLMIRAEGGRNDGFELWAPYNIHQLPTVAFMDRNGRMTRVHDRYHPMEDFPGTDLNFSAFPGANRSSRYQLIAGLEASVGGSQVGVGSPFDYFRWGVGASLGFRRWFDSTTYLEARILGDMEQGYSLTNTGVYTVANAGGGFSIGRTFNNGRLRVFASADFSAAYAFGNVGLNNSTRFVALEGFGMRGRAGIGVRFWNFLTAGGRWNISLLPSSADGSVRIQGLEFYLSTDIPEWLNSN